MGQALLVWMSSAGPCYPPAVLGPGSRVVIACLCIVAVVSAVTTTHAAPGSARPSTSQKGGKGSKGKAPKPKGSKAPAAKAPKGTAAPAREVEAPAPPSGPKLAAARATLDNGLRVVLSPDRTAPVVAVAVTYDVGARDDAEGRTGLASLALRLMFEGSRNVAPGDHARLVAARGGLARGYAGPDRTTLVDVLPASELALALWLEADRMRSLDVRDAGLEAARRAIQEERRAPIAPGIPRPAAVRLEELVFQGHFPYAHPALGVPADVDGASASAVKEHVARHYGPDTAVLTIAGDFDPDEAMSAVHRAFDGIPRIARKPLENTPLPEQTSQRTAVIQDASARAPAVLYGWPAPPPGSADRPALEVAAALLGARLQSVLVERGAAESAVVSVDGRRGHGLVRVAVALGPGARLPDVERSIEAEVKAIATRPPTDAELARARRRVAADRVRGLEAIGDRAAILGEHELVSGDAGRLAGDLAQYLSVSKDDVKRAAAEHLGPTQRTIVESGPPAPPSSDKVEKAPNRDAPRAATKKAPGKKAGGKPKKKKK